MEREAFRPIGTGDRLARILSRTTRIWMGADLAAWFTLLRRGGGRVSPSRFPLACLTTAWAAVSSVLGTVQRLRYGDEIQRLAALADSGDPSWRLLSEPLILLGHWRSGTTLLHELLGRHPRLFFPTNWECFAPHACLILDEDQARRLPLALPPTRPMDAMPLDWHAPQEDEFALLNLGLRSPYVRFAFPARFQDPGDLRRQTVTSPPADARGRDDESMAWIKTLRSFAALLALRRLVLRRPASQVFHPRRTPGLSRRRQGPAGPASYGPGRMTRDELMRCGRLVLKSPPHTMRLRLLKAAFPGARFVLLTRSPLETLPSTWNLWDKVGRHQGLQAVKGERDFPGRGLPAYILSDHDVMQDELAGQMERLEAIPGESGAAKTRMHVLPFDEIDPTRRPAGAVMERLEEMDRDLDLDLDLPASGDAMAVYLNSVRSYPKQDWEEVLTPRDRSRILSLRPFTGP